MTDEQMNRLAELFGLTLADVTKCDGDLEMLEMIGTRRPRLMAYKLDTLEAMPDPEFILKDWVPAGMTVVYAKPKGGKTFWVMTLAICFAAGINFYDRPVAGSGKVLYIAAEGSGKATWRRISRIAKALKVDMDELRRRLEVVTTGVKVDNPASVKDLLLLNPGTWGMVVVDTLARCMDGDESTTAGMNDAVAGLDMIRHSTQASSMIVVHHEGWEKDRLRGAIALFGALDGQIHVVRKDGLNYVQVQELREGAVPEPPDNTMVFHLDKEAGVLMPMPPQPTGVEKLTVREDRMFALLQRLVASGGGSVSMSDWRTGTKAGGIITASSERSWSNMWKKATDHMLEVGSVKVDASGKVRPVSIADDFPDDLE